jgi:hypothetical protein
LTVCTYKLRDEELYLLRYEAVWSVESQPTFRRNISPPAELCLPAAFTLVFCPAYFSTLRMESICYSETSVDFQRTTRRYIPEDSTLHNYRCGSLKYYKLRDVHLVNATTASQRLNQRFQGCLVTITMCTVMPFIMELCHYPLKLR